MKSILVNKIVQTDRFVLSDLFVQKGRIYTFLNPVSYLTAINNKETFGKFDGIFADGSILVASIRLLYGKKVFRRSFDMTSIAPELFSFAEKKKMTFYLVGSKQEQIKRTVGIFKERYPDISILGYRNGYFTSKEEVKYEVKHIMEIAPDFLIIGMGTLIQERFLLEVKNAGYKGIGFTCGGFIHQTSRNEINYYPTWVNRMNLRFIYRIYKEKHTRKRYFQAALMFPARFIYERIFG